MTPTPDKRLYSAAAERNTGPIIDALAPRLSGLVGAALEIGSGGGQHVIALAAATPALTWTPSDPDASARDSVAAWTAARRREGGALANLRAPIALDAAGGDWAAEWPDAPAALDVLYCANVIHIAPWTVAEGLFAGAARWLSPAGRLALYGPFSAGGVQAAPSNAAFDRSLRLRDPRFGVRDLCALDALAAAGGLSRDETIAMPANNHLLIYRRDA